MKNKNKQSVGYVMNDRAVIGFEQRVMPPWIGGIQSQGWGRAYAIRGNWIPAPVRARKRIDAGMTTNRRVGTAVSCPPFHISRGQTIKPFAHPTGLPDWILVPVRTRKRIHAGMTTNRRVGTAVSCPPFHIPRGQTIKPFAHPTGLFSRSRELEAEIKKQLVGLRYD